MLQKTNLKKLYTFLLEHRARIVKLLFILCLFSLIALAFIFTFLQPSYLHNTIINIFFNIFIFSPILAAVISGIRFIYKILIFLFVTFILYTFSVEHPTNIDYAFFIYLDNNEAEEFMLEDAKGLISDDNFVLKQGLNNIDLWLNKEIKEINFTVGGSEEYGYNESGGGKIRYLKMKINEENVNSRRFKIEQKNGEYQVYYVDLSWHGGVFWEQFSEKHIIKVHWLDREKFQMFFNRQAINSQK